MEDIKEKGTKIYFSHEMPLKEFFA